MERCSTRERELKHTLILAHSVSISLVPQCPSTTSISSRLHQSRLRSDNCDSSVITVPQLPQDQFLKHKCRKFCKCERGPQVLLQVPQVRERVSSTASAASAREVLKYRKCRECERGSQVPQVPRVRERVSSTASASSAREGLKYCKCLKCSKTAAGSTENG